MMTKTKCTFNVVIVLALLLCSSPKSEPRQSHAAPLVATSVASANRTDFSTISRKTGAQRASGPQIGQTSTTGEWHIECVDCPKMIGEMTDRGMRLDADAHPHIAYGGDHLYYAWYDGTAWHYETVDDDPGVGWHAALALDPAGNPHISYIDETNRQLRYAYWTGSVWDIQIVDGEADVVYDTALAVDAAGNPHIGYSDQTDRSVKYAYWTGSAWDIQTVDITGPVGYYPTLALVLDAAGDPHIGYGGEIAGDGSPIGLRYARWTDGAWDIQTVENDLPNEISLALDATGDPHVSYHGAIYDGGVPVSGLKYAHWTGSAWEIRPVRSSVNSRGTAAPANAAEGPPFIYFGSSLAVGPDGNPHISYYGAGLEYARWTGSAWDIQTVDGSGDTGKYSSLVLDADANPHFSHYGDALRYTRWTGSSWDTQIVDTAGQAGTYTSLALDALGRSHISYVDWINEDVKYARWMGSSWDIQPVSGSEERPTGTSLALDAAGVPHISYCSDNYQRGDGPKYAQWTGAAWDIQLVASDVDCYNTALVLDAAGVPHISYRGRSGRPSYARWTGNSWDIQTVDAAQGWQLSLSLDAVGNPHISYSSGDYPNYDLRYAFLDASGWHTETVVSAGAAVYGSLALDAAGNPHISYGDPTDHRLKLAYRDSSGWHTTTVDSVADTTGWSTALVLDAADNPHIGYYDQAGGDLKYAHWTGGSWDIHTVDSAGEVGSHNSLALDAVGSPHISYYDGTNGDLKHARLRPPLILDKAASPRDGLRITDTLTYTLTLSGPNLNANLWDPLPTNALYVADSITSTLSPLAVYSPTAHAIVWQGLLPVNTTPFVRFQVSPEIPATGTLSMAPAIVNTAWLTDETGRSASATVIVNGLKIYVPLMIPSYPTTVLLMHLDEPEGATTFSDSSSFRNHGTCAGQSCPMAGIPGRVNTALHFDGVDDFVGLGNPNSMDFYGEITIAAWVNVEATDGIRNIVAHGYTVTRPAEVVLRVNDGAYEIGSWDGTSHRTSYPIPAEDVGRWVHLAGVYDGASWRLYRNGVEASSMADGIGAVIVDAAWAIGARGTGTERFFQGDIDEVAVYARALSAQEIWDRYTGSP